MQIARSVGSGEFAEHVLRHGFEPLRVRCMIPPDDTTVPDAPVGRATVEATEDEFRIMAMLPP